MPHALIRPLLLILTGWLIGLLAHAQPLQLAADSMLTERARLWSDLGRLDLARENIDKLFRIHPDHPEGLALMAEYEIKGGNLAEARRFFDRLRRVHPGHPEINRIQQLFRLETTDRGRLREARRFIRAREPHKALAILQELFPKGTPSDDLALEYWGVVADLPNNWAKARQGLVNLVARRPDNPRYQLALAEHELSRNPLHHPALTTVVRLSKHRYLAKQAREIWRRALLRMPAQSDALAQFQIYLQQERGDMAAQQRYQALLKQVQINPRRAPKPLPAMPPSTGPVQLATVPAPPAATTTAAALATPSENTDSVLAALGTAVRPTSEPRAMLSAVTDWRTRSGTAGVSQVNLRETTVEWRRPFGDDAQLMLRADMVDISSGRLDLYRPDTLYDVQKFGSVLLCQTIDYQPDAQGVYQPKPSYGGACNREQVQQRERGAALNLAYERANLRADIGSTPIGFPIINVIGGVQWKGDIGDTGYTLDVSRRPLNGSLLSYAGARDPNTGTLWGGVTASGVRLGLSRDSGGDWGAWSSFGWHSLQGHNVATNERTLLMAGVYRRLINEDDRLLSAGTTVMYWANRRNLGEYSLGHGGYFSPQRYRSIAYPVTYSARHDRLSWAVRASASWSWSQTDPAPYYPTRPDLQAAAGDPYYPGGPGKGKGWGLAGSWEYRLDDQTVIGSRLGLDRSAAYSPNYLILYLRHALDKAERMPLRMPPEPVIPTSQF